jgi:dCTP deaminase
MSVLPDHWIREMARSKGMIEPFAENRVRKGKISFGASCYGYDFRLAREFKVPEFEGVKELDPKRANQLHFREHDARACVIPTRSFILARSLEYFRIPRDVLALCQGKSTYARCGLIVNVTPLEPEWEGFITISLVNAGPLPLRVYANEGIAQVVFLKAESPCRTSYGDRKGKYQAQRKIQTAIV